ncbi:MAG: hypothetical protein AB1Z23_11795 [Eubacteriales bacterium]
MVKVWGNIIKKNNIVQSAFLSFEEEPNLELYTNAIQEICDELDLEMPMILSKHKSDMNLFNLVKFTPADFIEKVDFQRFDIEIFIEKDNK